MKRLLVWMVMFGCGSGGSGSGGGLGEIDARCTSLCADDDAACSGEVTACEGACQVRVTEMQPACATCLIENADTGACAPGQPCCPDPSFPNSVMACAALCADSEGVNPANHPVCAALCADEDPACSAKASACLDECNARVQGVSGLCALCLLEDAHNGACSSGGPCCPDPTFPTSTTACAAFCQ